MLWISNKHRFQGLNQITHQLSCQEAWPATNGNMITRDATYIPNVTLDQLIPLRQANDLWISSMADASDGQITEGVVISNFFLGGIYTIEYLETQDYILSLSDYFGVV